MPLLDRFEAHLAATSLLQPSERLLVGYSGGPDSTCLLHLLHRLGFDIVAGHLHHGMRNEADQESNLCEAFCAELDIPCIVGRADVPRIAREHKIGLEEAGRKARYEFFRQAAFKFGCPTIVTAHTLDDQAETILMRLAKGAGLRGLSGIAPSQAGLVRPFLNVSRAETRGYCEHHGFWVVQDPANHDLRNERVRIRQMVVPELALINPEVLTAIDRTSIIVREEDGFMDQVAANAVQSAEVRVDGPLEFLSQSSELHFDQAVLRGLPPVLLRRSLRLMARYFDASMGYELAHEISDAILGLNEGSKTLPEGQVTIDWSNKRLRVSCKEEPISFRHPLTIPGDTLAESFGWMFTSYIVHRNEYSRDPMEAHLDAKSIKGNPFFKNIDPGDQFAPLGLSGSKKLNDLLSDRHFTLSVRRKLPILWDMVGPIWVPGIEIAERVKLTEATEQVLYVRFGPVQPGS